MTAAATRLGITLTRLAELVDAGELERRLIGDHYSISEESVTAYQERPKRIPVGEGAELPEDIEDEFRRGKDDYTDTPNDEGDNE
jgi:hypothetical protein